VREADAKKAVLAAQRSGRALTGFEPFGRDAIRTAYVLTGRGKAFSAGTDLKEMAQVVPEEEGQPVGGASASSEGGNGVPFNRFMEALIAFLKPLIAAVNGAGVGLGLTMLLHCDLVLVSTRARLLAPFTTMGVAPEAASSFLLPRRMGAQRAAYAFLTSEWITAQEAVDFGLELAADEAATVTFVHVVPAIDVVPSAGFGFTGAVPHELRETDTELLEQARARAEEAGVTAYTRLLRGEPADEIVAYADTVDADVIVVGSRGHGAVTSVLLGSVSRAILREARRPVLVVRGAAARHEDAVAV